MDPTQHLPAIISPHLLHLLVCLSAGVKFRSQQVQRDGGWNHAAEDSASLQAQTAAAGWLAGTMPHSPVACVTLESCLPSRKPLLCLFSDFKAQPQWWLRGLGLTLFVHPQVAEVLNVLFLCSHLMVCVHSAIKPSQLLATVMSLRLPLLNNSSSSSRPPPPVEWYIHTLCHTGIYWWISLLIWLDMCLLIERCLSYRNDVSMQFCGRGDAMCEQLVCHLGNLEVGREASIHLEVKLNPNVLLQAPVKHADNGFLNLFLRKRWVSQHWCPGRWYLKGCCHLY